MLWLNNISFNVIKSLYNVFFLYILFFFFLSLYLLFMSSNRILMRKISYLISCKMLHMTPQTSIFFYRFLVIIVNKYDEKRHYSFYQNLVAEKWKEYWYQILYCLRFILHLNITWKSVWFYVLNTWIDYRSHITKAYLPFKHKLAMC